jgi:hypothetical protein
MATQLDVDAVTPIRITPTYLVSPYATSVNVKKLLVSATFNDSNAAATQINTAYNALTPVFDSRIDAHFGPLIAGGGKWPWFVLGPKGTSVKFYFLNGQRRFALQRWEEPDRDALTIKLKHRVGVHIESTGLLQERRGITKMRLWPLAIGRRPDKMNFQGGLKW